MAFSRPIAIVTGAARGIGLCISERLLQSSYRVLLFDTKEKEGKEAERNLRSKHGLEKVSFMKGDVSSKHNLTDAFEKAKSEFGRIDLLINNAGIVAERNPDRTVAVNLMGAIYGSELALKYMGTSNGGKGGAVINVTSISGLLPYPDTPAYVATKHSLIGLTRSYGILREAETLNMCSPENVESMLMPVDRTAEGIVKILKDKRNGSILLVLPESMEYLEIPESLRKIPIASV